MTDTPDNQDRARERQERFLALYLPVADRLARYARAMTRSADEAMDVEGETILIAFERFDSVRAPEAFLSFLFTVARRVHTHSRKRGERFRLLEESDEERFTARDRSPEVAADVRLLYDALALLPARQREAVVLFEIAGLTLEDVREVQGGTLSGVKSRLRRGRETLASLLTDNPREHAPVTALQPAGIPAHEQMLMEIDHE